ncbi:hypothetical protein [Methylotetracoccus oryzae]|uniref:hypothetical protein n=1 Tax=Methylotetracoccus oryzae TaxID=1919059 RepID=UPI001118F4FF|nr:hypothetical protein [Methylotetracoccus oryzae]
MNTKFLTAALLAVSTAGITTTTSAATIYNTAPLFAGTTQSNAVCYIYNAGGPFGGSVHFNNGFSRIGSLSGNIVTDVVTGLSPGSNCPGIFGPGLPPGRACYVLGPIANNAAHTCRVYVTENNANLRVNLEIRDSSGDVLQHIDGQK